MDRKLSALSLLTYSLSNFFTFCSISFPPARGGCIIALLLGFSVIALIAFLNYIKTIKDGWQSEGGLFGDKDNFIVGLAPGLFFGCTYLVGIVSGIYLGWR
jgi:hypothetical protein